MEEPEYMPLTPKPVHDRIERTKLKEEEKEKGTQRMNRLKNRAEQCTGQREVAADRERTGHKQERKVNNLRLLVLLCLPLSRPISLLNGQA